MKILAISDTHGKTTIPRNIIDQWKEKVDLIIHLGDYLSDAKELSTGHNTPLSYVGGNMDGSNETNGYKTINTPYGKILLTHGHLDGVKLNPNNLIYRTEEMNCKAVVFGHTHSPFFKNLNGIYLINPGSITYPRLTSYGTYFILNVTEEGITHTEYKVELKTSPTSNLSGKLKGIFNNSDRF